jgi:cardiolipin synthase
MAGAHVEWVLYSVAAVLAAGLSALSAGHALLWKRDPRATLGWIGICLTLPLFGPLLYAMFGVNRVRRTALEWQARGRRLPGGSAAFRAAPPVLPTGSGTEHLAELRSLADRVTHRSLVGGNAIAPLHDGEAAYPEMLAAIASAKHSVHLSTYIFDGDRTGREFVDALHRAAVRGVEVRVLVDGLGEKYSSPMARHLFPFGTPVRIARFLPLRNGAYLNLRNHRKILVVDGRIAFTGGMNLGDRHLVTRPSRRGPVSDVHFRVEGPVISDLQKIFLEDWFFATGDFRDDERFFPPLPDAGAAAVRAIDDGPDERLRKIHWVVMGALSCASSRVRIMTPYFIPDRSLLAALGTTALRGIEVDLLLPGRNNLPFMHWAARDYLSELLPYGIRVRYQPPPFVHSKLLLVDGLWSLIGSANLDPRSLRLNFELDLEIYDPALAKKLGDRFDERFAASRPVTLEELERRRLPVRIRDGAAKLFSPYL